MFQRGLPLLLAAVLLAGCSNVQRTSFPAPEGPASPEPPRREPAPVDRQPAPDRDRSPAPAESAPPATQTRAPLPPRSAAEVSSPAVRSLLNRADTLAANGNMDMAAATLERALDIEPRNPFVYQQLATVRLAQGQGGQAENLARKSNSVAGDNPFVRTINWQLIAEARRVGGDRGGSEQALDRARDYRSAAQQLMQ